MVAKASRSVRRIAHPQIDHVAARTPLLVQQLVDPAKQVRREPVYSGSFGGERSFLREKIDNQLRKSLIIQKWTQSITRNAVDLLAAIVARSAQHVESAYPGSEFHVVFWDQQQRTSRAIVSALEAKGIRVHRVSDMLPDYYDRYSDYVLDEVFDLHPNQRAHELIAGYVSTEIVGKPALATEYGGNSLSRH